MKLRISLLCAVALCAKIACANMENLDVTICIAGDLPAEVRKEVEKEVEKDCRALQEKYAEVAEVQCSLQNDDAEKSSCCNPKPCCGSCGSCCKDVDADVDDSADNSDDIDNDSERCNCGKPKPRQN